MKRFSQLFHFIAVIIIAILGGTLYYTSASQDIVKKTVEYISFLIFILWPIIILFYSIKKKETIDRDKIFIESYRFFLKNNTFLYISNSILTISGCVLIYLFLIYREIEFKTHYGEEVRIYIDKDNTTNDPEIGVVDNKNPLSLRMRTGIYDIYFKSVGKSTILQNAKSIQVDPIFNNTSHLTFFLDFDEDDKNNK